LYDAGGLTATYHATLPNGTTDIDGGLISVTKGAGLTLVNKLIDFSDQYDLDTSTLAADGFSNTIDVTVANPGTRFTGGGSTDTLTIQIDETAAGVAASNATGEVVTAVVTGPFAFLVDEDPATAGLQNDSITATVNGNAAASVTLTSTTVTVVGAASDVGDVVISFDNANNNLGLEVMVADTFSSAVSIAYNDAGPDGDNTLNGDDVADSIPLSTSNAAGEWVLNGANAVVSAYPVGAGITQFLWVTNTGSQSAGISVTAKGDGGTLASCSVGTVAANDMEYIAPAVKTCLDNANFGTDRIQLTVTVNAASSTIDVYAGYKVDADADRLTLNVTQ
jgi:hypothetical protein